MCEATVIWMLAKLFGCGHRDGNGMKYMALFHKQDPATDSHQEPCERTIVGLPYLQPVAIYETTHKATQASH